MSAALKQIIQHIEALSSDEKALIAHCLISSLETKHDENVEYAWNELAEKRFSELEDGIVQGVSWSQLKEKIQR